MFCKLFIKNNYNLFITNRFTMLTKNKKQFIK